MPIHCPVCVPVLEAEAFAAVDYRVMGHAYAVQNDLGRLCDECAYQIELAARLSADGCATVHTRVPLQVAHRSFSKTYYLDLIAEGALYDLKTAAAWAGEHDTQLLNYILLLGLRRGKLINFRTPKVEGRLLATGLDQEARRRVVLQTGHWQDLTRQCAKLRETSSELLADWGAFLDLALYEEALVHFLGGAEQVNQRVSLARNGIELGTQRFHLHSPAVAFRLTAFTEGQATIESHLRRLLAITSLQAIQWINLNHQQIEFITIQRWARELAAKE